MEKYEEKLIGKIDFLHVKALSEQNKMNILMDIITRYQISLVNFSKSIENIKSLNTEIISEKDNSISNAFQTLIRVINAQIKEFKESSYQMLSSIIDPIMKAKDNKYYEEKNMFNQYNKLKNSYNNLKFNCEKVKKDYYESAKFCENNIHNLFQYKSNNLIIDNQNDNEIIKTEEKMKISIANAKILEEKYLKSIDEANNVRIDMLKKEEELLKFYQKLNFDFYQKISYVIIYIIPILKNLFQTINLELNNAEDKCKKINIESDINSFINNNTINLSQEKPIEFEPYYPQFDLKYSNISGSDKKELENLDINYHIIEILKNNFKDIRTDIDMSIEQKKFRLRFLCNQIFKIGPGISFTSEEKEELISLIKEPNHKSFFLITLSKQRTKGRFKRSEKLIKDLLYIIITILDNSQLINDFESIKNCIILSETFYFEKEKNKNEEENKKIYLIDYIKYYKLFQNIDFWEGIIEDMIQKEINTSEKININNQINETPEEKKKEISKICFSIVLSYANTMIEFNINKENINKIVDIFVNKYNIEENEAKTIHENVDSTAPTEINEENRIIFEELFTQFEKNKANKIIIEENIEINNENDDINSKDNEGNNKENENLNFHNFENTK